MSFVNALFVPLLVLIGGGIGAVTRYGVSLAARQLWGETFPWGTLLVNLAGCFLIGLTVGLAPRAGWLTPNVRWFFVTGFLGGLTTFSSFAMETVTTATDDTLYTASANFAANNVGGLAMVLAGMWLAKVI